MAKKNNKLRNKKIVDVNYKDIQKQQEVKPICEKGNYVISVVANGQIIKKIAVAGAEIYVNKLADGGLTVDLM